MTLASDFYSDFCRPLVHLRELGDRDLWIPGESSRSAGPFIYLECYDVQPIVQISSDIFCVNVRLVLSVVYLWAYITVYL